MTVVGRQLERLAAYLNHLEHRSKPWFVAAALVSYGVALVLLLQKIDPIADPSEFLVKALASLSVPFGVILLQELFELVTATSQSTLRATRQQFEIVALVILRSFFKDFYKLNQAVVAGGWSEPVQKALVKIVAIVAITVLILVFRRLIARAGVERRDAGRRSANLWKQAVVILLVFAVLIDLLAVQRSFETMEFISLVFTGLIAVDAVFFLLTILHGHEFDDLMFDGGLVVSLILARFPLFAANTLAYSLSAVGVGFATVCLYLFVRSAESEFLGASNEDDVERMDLSISNQPQELDRVGQALAAFASRCSIPKTMIQRVRLACDELLTNTLSYAYTDEAEHEIWVALALAGDRLTVTISDDGHPFNPFQHQPPNVTADLESRDIGGLGIHLVRNVMDRVAYRRHAGRNVITLLKCITTEDATQERH